MGGVMYKIPKSKEKKIVLCVSPNSTIKERLRDDVFLQILNAVEKFKAFEFDAIDNESSEEYLKRYYIVLNDPSNKKRVYEVIGKFNFEIIS